MCMSEMASGEGASKDSSPAITAAAMRRASLCVVSRVGGVCAFHAEHLQNSLLWY